MALLNLFLENISMIQVFKYYLSAGLKRLAGKGQRVIIVNMGNEDGWAKDANKIWIREKVSKFREFNIPYHDFDFD